MIFGFILFLVVFYFSSILAVFTDDTVIVKTGMFAT